MRRVLLGISAAVAALLLIQPASALPVFARQTGMECSSCHYQHFPLLTAFGRAFKRSAFTLAGSQAKVEGDRLALPAMLNMAGLTTMGYERTNAADANPANMPGSRNDGNGLFYMPGHNGELSLFFGGRINDVAGFQTEIGLLGPAAQSSAKLPILFEVADDTRAGVVPFTTNAQGAAFGFELMNTGATAVHMMSGVPGFNGAHASAISAQQFIGTGAQATGFALVACNDKGFINVTKYNQIGTGDLTGGNNVSGHGSVMGAGLDSTYLRLVHTFDLAGWDAGVGIQSWSGSSLNLDATAVSNNSGSITASKATAIDGQVQGDWRNLPVGIYVTYATAPADTALGNAYNSNPDPAITTFNTMTRSSFNVAGEVGVLPGIATLGAALRFGQSGVDDGTGNNQSDNAVFLTGTYKLSQNMLASLSFTSASGSYWNAQNRANIGSKIVTLNLFSLF
jgi:hypothetical protein